MVKMGCINTFLIIVSKWRNFMESMGKLIDILLTLYKFTLYVLCQFLKTLLTSNFTFLIECFEITCSIFSICGTIYKATFRPFRILLYKNSKCRDIAQKHSKCKSDKSTLFTSKVCKEQFYFIWLVKYHVNPRVNRYRGLFRPSIVVYVCVVTYIAKYEYSNVLDKYVKKIISWNRESNLNQEL